MSTHVPNPAHFPSYRKPSEKEGPSFGDPSLRQRSAQAFRAGADTYDDVRPGYPQEVAELIIGARTVLDVGAGTGKFTATLRNERVFACEPSGDMARVFRQRLNYPLWRATAEATALAPDSLDAVACAQTWHWVDVAAASTEFDRILRPGGVILLAWNTLAVEDDPWILRLARIMHSGDIQRPGFLPEVSKPWRIDNTLCLKWDHLLSPAQLHALMHTRSYWLRNSARIRERMTNNLNWYLYEHMGFSEEEKLHIPYRTDAFVLVREE
ncbi:class I SAM-dependent methyltransferase [Corynebacterium flavescens]|uniref:class I SAM-dependent methyltransferase n=1 Tax=Corynebacterium flavescens TaxID=28028 RepID=UPI003FCF9D9B